MTDWVDRAIARMKELGLRQNDLIGPLNVTTRGSVGHYLRRRRTPSPEQMRALASTLRMSMDELFIGAQNAQYAYPASEVGESHVVREPAPPPGLQTIIDIWNRLSPSGRATLVKVGQLLVEEPSSLHGLD